MQYHHLKDQINLTVCCNFRSDKKTLCNESVSGKNTRFSSAVPPPIPMSPIVEKMEGLKAIRNRSNSLRLGRLAFYQHLEKVETMRSFWELKHEEMEGGKQQVTGTLTLFPAFTPRYSMWIDKPIFSLHTFLQNIFTTWLDKFSFSVKLNLN